MRSQPVRSRLFDKDVLVDADIVVDDDVVEDEEEKSSLVRKNSKNKKFEKRNIIENDVTEDEVDKLENEDQNMKGHMGNKNYMICMATLEKCECVPKKGGVGRNSTVLILIKAQEKSITEIQRLKAENALLRVQLVEKEHKLGSSGVVEAANAENTNLRAEE
ncbi:hypothetical protein K7X08_012638 [Anisodus acutangulus]|uniref:Uncharacterized protein n=1 Tax=Anisodus acutangulus TaxID=402998 RepID=A0A9Q1RGK8_9SOLA|nr:hypothetical protein K7X08_012638 [Anisodus acutangulus]